MLAARKLSSVLTVLIIITSGVTLSVFAGEPPSGAGTEGTGLVDEEVIEVPEPGATPEGESAPDDPVPYRYDVELGTYTDLEGNPLEPASMNFGEIMGLEWRRSPDEVENLAPGRDGGRLVRNDYGHRAPNKILLVDDDDSSVANTTQKYNNTGPYEMDTGKIWSDALNAKNYDHDFYLVESGMSGPDYQTMAQYSTIIWAFGYEFGGRPTLTRWDYNRLVNFMEAGGAVWFTGPLWLYDMYGDVNRTVGGDYELGANTLARKYLGILEMYPMVGQPDPINGTSDGVMSGGEQYPTRNFFAQFGDWRSIMGYVLEPVASGGHEVLIGDITDSYGTYWDDAPFTIAYDSGTWKTATSSIDPAQLTNPTDRQDYIDKVMKFLGTPTIDLTRNNMMNMNVSVTDESPLWTNTFNFAFWGLLYYHPQIGLFRLYNPISACFNTHKTITYTCNIENHGPAKNNVPIRIVLEDAMGLELVNMTKTVNLATRGKASVTETFRPTRSGFYSVDTNVSIAGDKRWQDNEVMYRWRVAEWMDDLESGTSNWTKEGSWAISHQSNHYNTENSGWHWSRQGASDNDGDDLLSPVVDLRFYNTSFDHWYFDPAEIIYLNFWFKGRFRGTGQDYFQVLMKASNMTQPTELIKIDGNSEGENQVPGDFDDNWWYFGRGLYLGNYWGQTVQFTFRMVKRNAATDSWVAIDSFIVWQHHEKNVAPWFIETHPDNSEDANVNVDVGTSFDLRVFAEDPTMDEPITYEWQENYVPIPGEDTNKSTWNIPLTVPDGHKYHRGNVLEIVCNVRDDLTVNGTTWYVHLLDPRPVLVDPQRELKLTINEDEPHDEDFGTASNEKWFRDPEGQTFTVTSQGSDFIDVTNGANNVLTFENKITHWNGWDNVTVIVEDEMGSEQNFTFEVRVLPVNDPPKWKEGEKLDAAREGRYYSFNLTATDVDNEAAELTYSDDADFFEITASGEIAFKPANEHVGRNHFNVTVTDPDGQSDTVEHVLFVENVNQPPEWKPIGALTAREDEHFSFNLSDYVDDPDLLLPSEFRDRMNYRDDTTKLETKVETGEITWTPTNEDVGEHFFTVTVTDSVGRSDQQEIRITVENTNDPPTIDIIGKQNLVQGRDYEFTVPVHDDDLDAPGVSEQLTFTNDLTELFTINAATGRIDFTPDNEHVGVWEVTITVTDSHGASAEKTIVFDIENENDKPSIEYIPAQNLKEDVPFELQIEASDPDLEPRLLDDEPVDPNERLTYRTNNSRVMIDNDGKLTFTPTNEDAIRRTLVVRITVVDASSEPATVDVTFAIEQVNDPPENLQIIGLIDMQEIKEDTKVDLRGTATDQDHSADQLRYRWYAGTTLIGQTQDVQWKVKGKGLTPIKLVVIDGEEAETEMVINVTIKEVKDEPGFEGVFALVAVGVIALMAVAVRRRRT